MTRGARAFLIVTITVLVTSMCVIFGLFVIFQIRDQSRANAKHIDCIISVFARTDPPKCREIKRQLVDEGIFPAPTVPADPASPTPTTTTTTLPGPGA